MRIPLFAAALGLSLAGCVVGDTGAPGPGGDDGTGTDPGVGTDPGTGPGTNPAPVTPTMTADVDKASVTTSLGKTEIVTLTVTSGGSFAGDVAIKASLVDSAGAALADGITVTGQPSIALAADATATATYTVKIPTNATGADLTAKLNFDVSSTAGSKQLTTTLGVTAVYNVVYAAGLGGDVTTHPMRAETFSVKKGAKISVHNADTAVHITHGDNGFPHETQSATGGLANGTYVIDTGKLNVTTGNIGCHSHGSATYAKVTVE
jgi:hypothetical protein